MARTRLLTLGLAALGAALLAVPPLAAGQALSTTADTILISRAMDGGLPNGPSFDASISRDARIDRIVAFDSDATNLVPNDTNGLTDVFAVNRAHPWGAQGTDWLRGSTFLVSHGMNGAPANGRSYKPRTDGQPGGVDTTCIAFVSDASNLVPGDTNGKPDAFVYFLQTGRIVRVSVNSKGQQSNGTTFDVDVDGRCDHVAFTSDATNLALTKTKTKDWKPFVTHGSTGGHKEVYVRQIGAKAAAGDRPALNGLTLLVSASNKRRPANGDSFEPSFAYRFNGKNHRIGYTSTATNLSPLDPNTRTDVYSTDFVRGGLSTFLVSVNPQTRQVGNAPSRSPAMSETGRNVTYATEASNLLPNDTNGVPDIVQADLPLTTGHAKVSAAAGVIVPIRQKWVSLDYQPQNFGDGDSERPRVANDGDYVTYDSDAQNFEGEPSSETPSSEPGEPQPEGAPAIAQSPWCEPHGGDFRDRNHVKDVFLFTFTRTTNFLESRTSNPSIEQLRLLSIHPDISGRGNYIPYETNEPYADLNWVRAVHPEWMPDACDPAALLIQDSTRATAAATPAYHQIYMRYVGPVITHG